MGSDCISSSSLLILLLSIKAGYCSCKYCLLILFLSKGWMDKLGFYVPSTVFQSFRDDGRVNMKGSVQ